MLRGAALFDNSAAAVYIKILFPKNPEFYTPLALNCQKEQHLSALEAYKNQSPNFPEILENLEILEISENPQIVENKKENPTIF